MATDADGGVVELVEGDEMVAGAVSGAAAGSLGVRLSRAASLSGLCVRQGVPLMSEDTETDPRVDREACRRLGVRSMIAVPLIHRGYAVGVLKVVSSQDSHFKDSDQTILELMGGFITGLARCNSFTARDGGAPRLPTHRSPPFNESEMAFPDSTQRPESSVSRVLVLGVASVEGNRSLDLAADQASHTYRLPSRGGE